MTSHTRSHARFLLAMFAFLALIVTVLGQSTAKKWTFDADAEGKPPAGFSLARTGQGSEGQWVVRKDDSAPSKPNVLAQTSQDKTDYRFPLAIVEGSAYKDLALAVRFKAISGSVDQGAGLVFRLQDKDNYYVVRANALENNLRLYHVVKGQRVQFAGSNFKIAAGVWHEMRVEAQGNEIRCYFDGQLKMSARDEAFTASGKVGLWTKADSVIYFDDLVVEELVRGGGVPGGNLAQRLVDELAKRHPELIRVGVHVTPPGGSANIIVASNVAAKIGQESDSEDLQAMKTGRLVVLKEGENFDVTLPLHDAKGRMIGAIGLTLKGGGTEGDATERARAIASELEHQVPDKESLFSSSSTAPRR